MAERGISLSEVISTNESGQCIEDYKDDHPFPSALIPLKINGRFVHVVIAIDEKNDWGYIITAYEPDSQHFLPGYLKRKSKGEPNGKDK
jgi:hypothetical protein